MGDFDPFDPWQPSIEIIFFYRMFMLFTTNIVKKVVKSCLLSAQVSVKSRTPSAQASAVIYSVVETAKENGLNLQVSVLTFSSTDLMEQLLRSTTIPEDCRVPSSAK